MFGRSKITFADCKQYLLQNISILNPQLNQETSSTVSYNLIQNKRVITLKIAELSKGIITVDVTDSFYLLRIPNEKFKDFTKYKNYMLNLINKIVTEIGLE